MAGARVVANHTAIPSGTEGHPITKRRVMLLGYSARESGRVPQPSEKWWRRLRRRVRRAPVVASFILRDGTDARGDPVVFVSLPAGEAVTKDFGALRGVEFQSGIFLDRVSGETEVTAYI